jgi:hypothetical protein
MVGGKAPSEVEKLIRREHRGQSQEPASPWRGTIVTWITAL